MATPPPPLSPDEERLGVLCMKFRRTRDEAGRHAIARDYAETVDRLIHSGTWQEVPAAEDQLPDDWMPKAFFAYWFDEQDPQ
jgi:hypothetical protein